MPYSPARWTSVVAAAALMTLPLAASAQTPPPATPPTQQIAPQTPPAQPPADAKPTNAQPQDTKVDAAAAKQHLGEARDTLSQLTSMPEAARLQGEARTQVSEVIANFNELITTQSDWRSAYGKVAANLATLLGPDSLDQAPPASGVAGAVGTSGTGAIQLDPGIRAKLAEFRTHLKEFERAAGSNATGAMAPSAVTGTTANPANPAPTAAAGATGTSGVMPASPTATMAPADQTKAAEQVGHSEADKHLDAISAILNQSKTGTLTKTQTAALKKHVAELRQLLQQGM